MTMTQDATQLAAAKAQLVEDFGKVVADTEALLASLGSVSGEKAAAMRDSLKANLETTRVRLRELQAGVVERASGAAKEADAYVHENPWTAVGLAAAVGVIVGLMISRR
jgi:ElaB/YqjD/DUF883 family membrane-anchored ribosome-binding protein